MCYIVRDLSYEFTKTISINVSIKRSRVIKLKLISQFNSTQQKHAGFEQLRNKVTRRTYETEY